MNTPTDFQTILGADGQPAFVVMPYSRFMQMYSKDEDLIPHAVVEATVTTGATPVEAWRRHLGLTQAEMGRRLGISQGAYNKQEHSTRLRKATLARIARAMGISLQQLDF